MSRYTPLRATTNGHKPYWRPTFTWNQLHIQASSTSTKEKP